MQRSTLTAAALFLSTLIGACAPADADGNDTPAAPDGAELYRRQSCGICHGPHGDGSALAPGLRDLGGTWTVPELAKYLVDPAAYAAGDERLREQAGRYPQMMPPYRSLEPAQREALARYVLELADG